MKRQTMRERSQLKTELAQSFDQWNKMTDDELMEHAKKRFAALSGTPNRGQLIKFLTMDSLDKLN